MDRWIKKDNERYNTKQRVALQGRRSETKMLCKDSFVQLCSSVKRNVCNVQRRRRGRKIEVYMANYVEAWST